MKKTKLFEHSFQSGILLKMLKLPFSKNARNEMWVQQKSKNFMEKKTFTTNRLRCKALEFLFCTGTIFGEKLKYSCCCDYFAFLNN